jgi:V/A-type H+/Na+-transporting ATPase subunit I
MAVVKMRRVSIIGPHSNKDKILGLLQQAGVIDIIEKKLEELPQFKEGVVLDKIDKSLKVFDSYEELFEDKENELDEAEVNIDKEKSLVIEELCDKIVSYDEDIQNAHNNLINLKKALSNQKKWGDFDYRKVKELQDKAGIYFQFWATSTKTRIDEEKYKHLIVINTTKKEKHFITISKKPYEAIPECNESIFTHSIDELKSAISDVKKTIEKTHARLFKLNKELRQHIEKERVEYENRYNFQLSKLYLDDKIDGKVYVLQGWCPVPELDKLNSTLSKNSVYMKLEEPTKEDDVPVTIRNSAFTKLFEPITNLFMLPDYFELDLTVLFAPLFWLFFGICLGDAGWGAILLVGAAVGFFVVKKNLKRLMVLGMLFAVMTVIVGLLTGSMLGFSTRDMPVLKEIVLVQPETIDLSEEMTEEELARMSPEEKEEVRIETANRVQQDMMFKFALLLGVFQIYLGLIANAVNKFKYGSVQEGFYPIGTMIFLAGIFILAAPLLQENFPQPPALVTNTLLIVGLLMILLFNSTGNILKRLGGGLWELYNVVTGFFGDVLSYIRLFALGLAGSILAYVINQIAQSFLGLPIPLNFLVYFVFLIVFHIFMMLLNALGSFVHPLRLTFVEFYKNAGFKGTFNVYQPFSLKKYQGKAS